MRSAGLDVSDCFDCPMLAGLTDEQKHDLVAYLERTMDQADIVRLVDELKLDLAPLRAPSTSRA